jgi:PleD family two-component response regulator
MARVLIVQGHARSRADTAATLRAQGHDVLEAGSADNGVRMAHEQGPEVIPLDPMPGTRLDAAWYVAERVRRRTAVIGAAPGPDGPTLTASFGVAEHRPPDTWRDLLDRAEAALTRVKRAGRSRCEVA